jgi:hypothetical protein
VETKAASGGCGGTASHWEYSGAVLLLPLWRERRLAALSAPAQPLGSQPPGLRSRHSGRVASAQCAGSATAGDAPQPGPAGGGEGQQGVAVLVGCKQLTAKALRISIQKVGSCLGSPGQ